MNDVSKEVAIPKQFYDANLIEHIYSELDKKHKKDDFEKLALFIIRATGELKNPSDRCSAALKGESSAGKDNAIKTVFDLFPGEDGFILTRGTQSALEEKAQDVKAIAFSEMNANRENGANGELTEFFKQLSEGGCKVFKRDKKNEIVEITTDQKCLFYGTTDTETDDELQTRYVVIPIRSNKEKNRTVIDDCLLSVSSPERILNKIKQSEWIANGVRHLEHNCEVIIPFANELMTPIKDTDGKEKFFFDATKDRVKRDIKRLLSLTKAVAWLHQKNRCMKEIGGTRFIYAEPSDFLLVIEIFSEFFNLTYSGLDHRLETCFEKVKELEGKHDAEIMMHGFGDKYNGWVLRHKLAEELGISSVNTIKERINVLKDNQLVETYYHRETSNKGYLVKSAGCQSGVNRVSLPVSLTGIDTHLTGTLTPTKIKEIYNNKVITPVSLEFLKKKHKGGVCSEKLTPIKLTPSKSRRTPTPCASSYSSHNQIEEINMRELKYEK